MSCTAPGEFALRGGNIYSLQFVDVFHEQGLGFLLMETHHSAMRSAQLSQLSRGQPNSSVSPEYPISVDSTSSINKEGESGSFLASK